VSSKSRTERPAPAKLNLFLEVLGRRPDGYHEIDSVFAEIDLADTVTVEKADRISLAVEGEAPAGPANLAWRAAEVLGVGAHIRLVKRIPAGAGLGGGSSDAAAVLQALDALYGLGADLPRLAAGLGADVPFFLVGGTARCRGAGERVTPVRPPRRRVFTVCCPRLPVATQRVYEALEPGLTGDPNSANVFLRRYLDEKGPAAPGYANRLETAALRVEPRLEAVREAARAHFGAAFVMSGSGSAFFAEVDPGPEPSAFDVEGIRVDVRRVRTK